MGEREEKRYAVLFVDGDTEENKRRKIEAGKKEFAEVCEKEFGWKLYSGISEDRKDDGPVPGCILTATFEKVRDVRFR